MANKYALNKGLTLWLTGLSGAGKSTLAKALYEEFSASNVEILDGDEIRQHLSKDLGFSKEDRLKNIERIAYLAGKLSKHKILVIVPVIAPYESGRKMARSLSKNFIEVYVKADVETVKNRDVKGLYKKAESGEIENFTGISDPYEEPVNPDILVNTSINSVNICKQIIIEKLKSEGYVEIVENM